MTRTTLLRPFSLQSSSMPIRFRQNHAVRSHRARRCLLMLSLCLGSGATTAHEGHDHGEPPPSVALPMLAPRAEASGDLFEVLVRADGPQLTLWVDRFASNEPVTTARVEIEGQGWKAVATPMTDGSYRFETPAQLRQAGSHPMVITVQLAASSGKGSNDEADLLETTLQLPAPDTAASAPSTAAAAPASLTWGAAALVAVAAMAGALWALARRRNARLRPDRGAAPTLG